MASDLTHGPRTHGPRTHGWSLGRRSAPVDRAHSWRRELALVSVLYLAYAASRLASLAPADAAARNGHRVLDLERTLHIAPEHTMNNLLYSAPRWLSIASAYFYETAHYAVTVATLIWLYRSSSAAYRRARNWLVAMTFPALIVFWLFPVAPPRTTGAVAHDIIAEQHQYGWWGAGGGTAPRGLAGLVNDNAAMPSLHVGWALWVGWNLAHSARNPLIRAFGYVYPLITIFVVLSTGNHYLLDVLAGAFLALAAKVVTDRARHRTGSRFDRAARSHPPAASWSWVASRPVLRRAAVVASAAAIVVLDVHLIGPYVSRAAAVLSNPVMYWVAIALAAEIVSIVATAALQRRMLRTTGIQVDKRTAVGMAYAAYAINMSLPAGPAVSAGYTFRRLRQLGATPPAAGFTLISSGVLNALSYALVAVGGFTLADGSTGGPAAVVIGLIAAGLLVFGTRSLLSHPAVLERFGGRALRVVNRVLRREPDAGMPGLRNSTSTLSSIRPSGRDWAIGMTAALINWIGDLGCLFAACQAVGANGATIGVVVPAYLGGTSVSGISLVPGGLGIVDAALIVILVHNGVGTAQATAAVLLYRALSLGFGALAGWSAWIGHARAVHRAEAADAGTPTVSPKASHDFAAAARSRRPRSRRAPDAEVYRAGL